MSRQHRKNALTPAQRALARFCDTGEGARLVSEQRKRSSDRAKAQDAAELLASAVSDWHESGMMPGAERDGSAVSGDAAFPRVRGSAVRFTIVVGADCPIAVDYIAEEFPGRPRWVRARSVEWPFRWNNVSETWDAPEGKDDGEVFMRWVLRWVRGEFS